eukprot:1146756-Pelagomonas_calceolata.AAC.3
MSCVIMDTGRPVTRAQLGCSTDGAYVSVVWPAARQYTIYRQGAASWESCIKEEAHVARGKLPSCLRGGARILAPRWQGDNEKWAHRVVLRAARELLRREAAPRAPHQMTCFPFPLYSPPCFHLLVL